MKVDRQTIRDSWIFFRHTVKTEAKVITRNTSIPDTLAATAATLAAPATPIKQLPSVNEIQGNMPADSSTEKIDDNIRSNDKGYILRCMLTLAFDWYLQTFFESVFFSNLLTYEKIFECT